jgi:hypothetical protein
VPVAPVNSNGNGVHFLVSAGIVYEIIAANCSSPQTAEINADTRAATLMKWVNIGCIQSVLFVGIAATVDPKHAKPLIAGGALAGIIMYGCYMHGKASGLSNPGPGTEGQTTGPS